MSSIEAAKKFADQFGITEDITTIKQELAESNPIVYRDLLIGEKIKDEKNWNEAFEQKCQKIEDEVTHPDKSAKRRIAKLKDLEPPARTKIIPEPGKEADYPPFLIGLPQQKIEPQLEELSTKVDLDQYLKQNKYENSQKRKLWLLDFKEKYQQILEAVTNPDEAAQQRIAKLCELDPPATTKIIPAPGKEDDYPPFLIRQQNNINKI